MTNHNKLQYDIKIQHEDGITSEQEYLNSIKFLIENNIIVIDKPKETTTIEEPIY